MTLEQGGQGMLLNLLTPMQQHAAASTNVELQEDRTIRLSPVKWGTVSCSRAYPNTVFPAHLQTLPRELIFKRSRRCIRIFLHMENDTNLCNIITVMLLEV